eukprot:m.390069 g.390069  ORF g.390069 m.390069 type:complete len:179 (-) comp21055_c4_seq25:3469-4005(-)
MAQLTVVVPVHPDEECTTIAECCHFLKVNAAQQPPVPALFVTAYDRLTDKETSAAWLRSQHPSAEWVHEKTATTRAKAMNEGFSRVKTQFVLFVHCDTRVCQTCKVGYRKFDGTSIGAIAELTLKNVAKAPPSCPPVCTCVQSCILLHLEDTIAQVFTKNFVLVYVGERTARFHDCLS